MNRTCTKCNIGKPYSQFGKQKNGKYGLRSACKDCTRKQNIVYVNNHRGNIVNYDKKFYFSYKGFIWKMPYSTKSRAKKRSLVFEIDKEWLEGRIGKMKCEVTGFKLEIMSGKKCKVSPTQPSLDRIDPSIGYTKENTRVVCWWYNVMKHDWSDKEVVHFVKEYYNKLTNQ